MRNTKGTGSGERRDVYQDVTDAILAQLEAGTVPWRKPWGTVDGLAPRNFNSGRGYRGINVFLLTVQPYGSPFWLTFKGAKAAGGSVRKGERSTLVVFWKTLDVEDRETGEAKSIPMLRHYRVFNVEQCDGIDAPQVGRAPEFDPIAECEAVLSGMPNAPTIGYGGPRAFYRPDADHVQLPARHAFNSAPEFYSTAFHELGHATGHSSRLNREDLTATAGFGTQTYSREELVAEMSAAMLCGHCGIAPAVIDNSAAYIASWLRKLRDDRKLVVTAAARAQRASDYILGVTW